MISLAIAAVSRGTAVSTVTLAFPRLNNRQGFLASMAVAPHTNGHVGCRNPAFGI